MFIIKTLYKLFVTIRAKQFGINLHVNGWSKVSKNTILGNNVNFNGIQISGEGIVRIGDNFHSGKGCLIIAQNHNDDKGVSIPYDNTYISRGVVIEDNVWIGDRVIILDGSKIGEGAIIQAGSVVAGNIPPLSISGGHPAKPFKSRDKEHYYRLKNEKKFF